MSASMVWTDNWTTTDIDNGKSIRGVYIQDMRTNLSKFYSPTSPGRPATPSYLSEPVTAGVTSIRAQHILDLRTAYDNAQCCGDKTCDAIETPLTCPGDCAFTCPGLGSEAALGENCSNCPADCGACSSSFYWCTSSSSCTSGAYANQSACQSANPGKTCYPDNATCVASASTDCASSCFWNCLQTGTGCWDVTSSDDGSYGGPNPGYLPFPLSGTCSCGSTQSITVQAGVLGGCNYSGVTEQWNVCNNGVPDGECGACDGTQVLCGPSCMNDTCPAVSGTSCSPFGCSAFHGTASCTGGATCPGVSLTDYSCTCE